MSGNTGNRLLSAMRAGIRPAIAVPYAIAARTTGLPPSRVFRYMTPTEWCWLNTHPEKTIPSLRGYLPAMPSQETQVRFTGNYGEATLYPAFRFYQAVTRAASSTRPRVAMDFGCGWGRITRFFIKDFQKGDLIGVDPLSDMVEICRATNPWATFKKIDLFPPVDLPDSSVDLIFAYSVFSHLTEDVHLEWIKEFGRLLRRGGTLVVTTRRRDFILECDRIRSEEPDQSKIGTLKNLGTSGARSAFLDSQRYLDLYDKGEYCCDPTGAGDSLPSATYGETCIPLAYVKRKWQPEFSVPDFIEDVPGVDQDVIVARRA
jgi:SAM-dependent methyltransferase